MGRRIRPYLPGGTFHLAARVQGRQGLFSPPTRTALVGLLREEVVYADVELFAYVFMANHLHLVVRQGIKPLHRFMQSLLRRAALLVHNSQRSEGHVFERRYRDHLCATAGHLRNAIVYTHLNPLRAGLCTDVGGFPWSSRGAWLNAGPAVDRYPHPTNLETAPLLFATEPHPTTAGLRSDYLAFEGWRLARDRLLGSMGPDAEEMVHSDGPSSPPTVHGDLNWLRYLAPPNGRAARVHGERGGSPSEWKPKRADLSAIARAVLADSEPGLIASQVRSRWGGPPYVRARHRIVRRAAAAGYRGTEIAAYLRISTGTVSDVLTASRRQLIRLED